MMNVENWGKTKERFNAFWENEITDRCSIAISSPNGKPWSNYFVKPSYEQKWLDAEFRYNKFTQDSECIYYAGEAFPQAWSNFGPGVLANFVGSKFMLDEDTIWFDRDPMIKNLDNFSKLTLDKNSILWQKLMDFNNKFYPYADKNLIVAMTDLGGTLDIAASLRGSENLMMDMYDEPEKVKDLINQIDKLWLECFNEFCELNDKYQNGYSTWEPLWCKEKWYPLQCDISVMLSPKNFEEFVKPSLSKVAKAIDGKVMYHLDGPGEIVHLDHILDIEEINAIEWVPMYKNGYLDVVNEEYFEMYKKIQRKGRSLVLRCIDPNLIEKLLENISPKGLFLSTWVNSKEDADAIMGKMSKWTAQGIRNI